MLFRNFDNTLVDLPDDVAILVLTDPSDDENLSDFTSHDINVMIHGVLGFIISPDNTFEENIQAIKKRFTHAVDDEKRAEAQDLIRKYHVEIDDKDIGVFPAEDMLHFD